MPGFFSEDRELVDGDELATQEERKRSDFALRCFEFYARIWGVFSVLTPVGNRAVLAGNLSRLPYARRNAGANDTNFLIR